MSPLPPELLRYWRVHPAAGEAWVETFAALQFAAYALRDTDGRPLGEENVPEPWRAGVDFEEKPCPYDDDRRGKPMNVTALRTVRRDWAWVGETTAAVRRAYAVRYGLGEDPLDLLHLFSFAAALGAWPMYLVRSGGCGPDGVPVDVGSLFKVVQGVFMTAWGALRASDGEDRPLPAVPALVRSIVASRILHGRSSSRVCGGSEALIAEILERCIHLRPGPVADAAFLEYGCTYAAFSLEKWLRGRPPSRLGAQVASHRDRLLGGALAIPAIQARLCRACGLPPPSGDLDPAWLRT